MNINKALYISDLDGTLLNSSAKLSEYTMNALNALIANGLHFTIATARRLDSIKMLDGLTLNIPIVLQGGVLIYDIHKQCYVKINTISPEAAAGIIKILRSFEITGFIKEFVDGEIITYHECHEKQPLREFIIKRIDDYYKSFRHSDKFPDMLSNNIIYSSVLDTYERLAPVRDALVSTNGISIIFYKDNYSDLWYLEISSDKASKQGAIEYLREAYSYERIVGFGDNLNDLPMFAACDVQVAVENAKPEVRAAADYICGTNDNDGVAKWLEEHVL